MSAAACASRPRILPGKAFTGRVTALDSVVDEATRNVQVQATLANPQGKLRPGMFVQVEVVHWAQAATVITLPASAINYAPYGDSVFVITDLKDPEREHLPRRAPAVREGRRLARRSGGGGFGPEPGDEVVTLGRVQAAQRRRCPGQQQSAAGKQSGSQARGQLRHEVYGSIC